jgi:hypothetical protein
MPIYIAESAVVVVFIFFYYSAQRVILSTRAPEINRPLIGRETPQVANTASGVSSMRLFPLARINIRRDIFFLWQDLDLEYLEV